MAVGGEGVHDSLNSSGSGINNYSLIKLQVGMTLSCQDPLQATRADILPDAFGGIPNSTVVVSVRYSTANNTSH
ncbi:hypothetical protein TNIN_141441 [Trichonephila inaurata madagascariensis]|uniref:Uncharacterized protein n=1 Tax=Trichonephila inaurata madagascariensis TaxID=2747483 RepID=A0A8X6K733_9ARAC|nr:hypothetical protein TNIN_141441 [Trichonephila inaurata madagascariensis]